MTDGASVTADPRTADTRSAVEADLLISATPGRPFDLAEAELGPVDVLINNADRLDGRRFVPQRHHRPAGRTTATTTSELFERTFGVDARATALLIAEFARRHLERGASWGRIVGLTSGGPNGFPSECHLRCGEGGARELHDVGRRRAR